MHPPSLLPLSSISLVLPLTIDSGAGVTGFGDFAMAESGATPTLLATTLSGFGNVCINTTSTANTFTITGNNLTTANVT